MKKYAELSQGEGLVRQIIFGLIIYYGFTKAEVVEFLLQEWDCIKFAEKKVTFRGIDRRLPLFLEAKFKKLKKLTGKKKQILGNKGERGQSISKDIVSAAFDEIKKMKEVEGRKYFTPEYTRKMLIVNMFDMGFAIEEICGYVGISLGSLEKILGKEYVARVGLKRWNLKNRTKSIHPFEIQFNKID